MVVEEKFESKFNKFIEAISSKINSRNEKYDQMFKHHSSSIHNIGVQLGQLTNVVTTRAQGYLLSNTKVNLKEQVKVISLRSGRENYKSLKICH